MARFETLPMVSALGLLCLAIASCLAAPARAAPVLGTLSVEDSTTHLHTIDVALGSAFKVDVWTRNVPRPGVVDLHFGITWNPQLIGFVSREINDHGFGVVAEAIDTGKYEGEFVSPFPHSGFTTDASWVIFTLRCLGEGSSRITITYSHGSLSNDHEFSFSPENATVDQHTAQPQVDLTHNISTLWPLLTTAGAVACIAILAMIIRNRRA
jgi:hypothetical protein